MRGGRWEDAEDNVTGGGQRSRAACPTRPVQSVAKFAAFWSGEQPFAVGVGACVARYAMRSKAETFWHQAKVRKLCPLSAALWPALVSHPKDGRWLCQPRDPDFARLPAPPNHLVVHVQSWYAFVSSACVTADAVCWVLEEEVAQKYYSDYSGKMYF